jgi:hypothetical protein
MPTRQRTLGGGDGQARGGRRRVTAPLHPCETPQLVYARTHMPTHIATCIRSNHTRRQACMNMRCTLHPGRQGKGGGHSPPSNGVPMSKPHCTPENLLKTPSRVMDDAVAEVSTPTQIRVCAGRRSRAAPSHRGHRHGGRGGGVANAEDVLREQGRGGPAGPPHPTRPAQAHTHAQAITVPQDSIGGFSPTVSKHPTPRPQSHCLAQFTTQQPSPHPLLPAAAAATQRLQWPPTTPATLVTSTFPARAPVGPTHLAVAFEQKHGLVGGSEHSVGAVCGGASGRGR